MFSTVTHIILIFSKHVVELVCTLSFLHDWRYFSLTVMRTLLNHVPRIVKSLSRWQFELKDVKLNLVTFIPEISNQISKTAPTNSQKLSPNSNLRIEICSFRTRCRYCKLLRPLDIGLYDNSSCDRRCVLKRVKCSKRFSPYKTRRLNTGVCTLIVRFFKLCNLVK